MKRILAFNSVNLDGKRLYLSPCGKRLYLSPWIEGSHFQRNKLPCVSSLIKLVDDVPHSYWTKDGLGFIAKAIGKPLSMYKQTAMLEPMKYTGLLGGNLV